MAASKRKKSKVVRKAAKTKAKGKVKAKPARKAAPKPKAKARPAAVPTPLPAVTEFDERIALIRNNLRDLAEQAAASAGGGVEERIADRISEQEARLDLLIKQRDALAKKR